ncbi:uncharacterized protein LOC133139941 [Conger conger]|uniref:uncharacterized protein LOC133139941 n=1 Tax=Conger conger TaxID=82655 RepID=UPI002A59DC87|nr:uncharacterized protein LOC133139941 [Conger conger]
MILYTFQLTCILALGHCCTNLTVRQIPESAYWKEGASVNFSCTFTFNVNSFLEFSVEWYKNASIISYKRYNLSERQDFTDILPLHSIQRNQSGKYFCNVSIILPCMERGSGSGTNLIVEVLEPPGTVRESSSSTVVWTSLLPAVLAVGLCCVIYSKRKGNKRNTSTGQETGCPTPDLSEVVYAKPNFRNFKASDGSNSTEAQGKWSSAKGTVQNVLTAVRGSATSPGCSGEKRS